VAGLRVDGWPEVVLAGTVLAVLLSCAEWIDPEDRNGPRAGARAPAGRRHVAWFAVYLTYAPMAAVMTTWAAAAVVAHDPVQRSVARLPAGARIGGAIVIADLIAYWFHRSMHRVPALWRVHRVHHEATDVRWWSTFRFHPVDGALAHAVPILGAAACGFGAGPLSVYIALVFAVTVFAHADVWMPGGWARRVVVLPAFHRSHHEVDRDDLNYGLVLSVWDTIFGTASHEVNAGARRFGSARQRSTANPIASDARFATQLTANAAAGSARRCRQTSAASR
jgi:sterol desaturase/sphingolipid hydroxylase (fatty acid hydroxylase superfamily)